MNFWTDLSSFLPHNMPPIKIVYKRVTSLVNTMFCVHAFALIQHSAQWLITTIWHEHCSHVSYLRVKWLKSIGAAFWLSKIRI